MIQYPLDRRAGSEQRIQPELYSLPRPLGFAILCFSSSAIVTKQCTA